MKKKKIIVLGLGIFGMSVAKTLTEYGQIVLGVDIDEELVSKANDITTNCICGDFTRLATLQKLNVSEYDVVVIGESSNLEASLVTLTNLKSLGAKYIIAKAKNNTQKEMLEKLGADLIIKPETEMAERLAKSILNKNIGDIIEIADDYSLIEITILQSWVERSIKQLDLRKNYGINVVGYKASNAATYNMSIDPNHPLSLDDHLLILIHKDQLNKLSYLNQK